MNTVRQVGYDESRKQFQQAGNISGIASLDAGLAIDELMWSTTDTSLPDDESYRKLERLLDIAEASAEGKDTFGMFSVRILRAYLRPMVLAPTIQAEPMSTSQAKRANDVLDLPHAHDAGTKVAEELLRHLKTSQQVVAAVENETQRARLKSNGQLADEELINKLICAKHDYRGTVAALNELTPLLLFGRHMTARCFATPATFYDDRIRPDTNNRIDGILYANSKHETSANGYQVKSTSDTTSYTVPVLTQEVLGNSKRDERWSDLTPYSFWPVRAVVYESKGTLRNDIASRLDSLRQHLIKQVLTYDPTSQTLRRPVFPKPTPYPCDKAS